MVCFISGGVGGDATYNVKSGPYRRVHSILVDW